MRVPLWLSIHVFHTFGRVEGDLEEDVPVMRDLLELAVSVMRARSVTDHAHRPCASGAGSARTSCTGCVEA